MNLGAFSAVKPSSFATVRKLSLMTFTHSEMLDDYLFFIIKTSIQNFKGVDARFP